MVSIIKSLPDPNDLEDFVLTKAEKVCHFGSPVGNDEIRQVIDLHIPKNTQTETIPEFQDLNFNLHRINCSFNLSVPHQNSLNMV